MPPSGRSALAVFLLACGAAPASAQPLSEPLHLFDGPPAPIAPAVVARDTDGRATVRATRIAEPIVIDGRLDEPSYQRVVAIADFVQQEPAEGEAVTEKTEAWLFFDDRNIYVAARCWDSHPERQVANEMRRDGQSTNDNESFAVVFDTFFDHRNGLSVSTGARRRLVRRVHHRRARHEPRLEHGLGWPDVAIRRRLDRRDGHSVQVAAVQDGTRSDLGRELQEGRALEERDAVSDAHSRIARPARHQQAFLGGHARRHRAAAVRPEFRGQAVRHCRLHEQSSRWDGFIDRPAGRRGARREGRSDRRGHRGLHLQHGFRAGRGRRAAGQPDALQRALSREARFLPRGPGDFLIRRRAGAAARGWGRRRRWRRYLARTDGDRQEGGTSYGAQLDYNADRYGLQIERLSADEHFNPDVGFLRRAAFIRNSV